MDACCFRRPANSANEVNCPYLPTQAERDAFEKRCRNYCIKGHQDQADLKANLDKWFKLADADNSGNIDKDEFTTLIELTAEEPRRMGFVPSLEVIHKGDINKIQQYRDDLFVQMQAKDGKHKGHITLESYTNWALEHIRQKVIHHIDSKHSGKKTEQQAKDEAHKLVNQLRDAQKSGRWDKVLKPYRDMFNRSVERGGIDKPKFDRLVELFAEKPRVLGLVPAMTDLYENDVQKMNSGREEIFSEIFNINNKEPVEVDFKADVITWDQFQTWLIAHLKKKLPTATCPMSGN